MCTTVTQIPPLVIAEYELEIASCPWCGDDEVLPNLPTHERSDSSGEHCQSLLLKCSADTTL